MKIPGQGVSRRGFYPTHPAPYRPLLDALRRVLVLDVVTTAAPSALNIGGADVSLRRNIGLSVSRHQYSKAGYFTRLVVNSSSMLSLK